MSKEIAAQEAEVMSSMESRLENTFRPVRPSRKFVQTMRSRIQIKPPALVINRLADTRRTFLVIAGVFSASVLIASGVRALFYLVNKSRS
jgi:hypothetical protein